jgi:inner membrane protein
MDSITQVVLGAACVAALAPKACTRRALLYGAALGTLPDLDALVPFRDPLDHLILHRSASHSLLVLPIVGWLLFQISRRWDQALRIGSWAWFVGFQLALITHPLIDFLTNYGTQLFWPISRYPFATSSVFIVDPVVTIPLLLACVMAWRRQGSSAASPDRRDLSAVSPDRRDLSAVSPDRRDLSAVSPDRRDLSAVSPDRRDSSAQSARKPLHIALIVATSYLALGLITQAHTQARVLASAPKNAAISVAAAPLTSLMHRVVVKTPGQYSEAYVSIFDGDAAIRWSSFPSADGAFPEIEATHNFQRLQQFSKGMLRVSTANDAVIVQDLRMGSEPFYVFGFDFGPADAPLDIVKQLPMQRPSAKALPWIAKRVITPAADLPLAHQMQ